MPALGIRHVPHGSLLTPCWREIDSNPRSPGQKDNAFRDSSFATCAARHRRLPKRSPPRPVISTLDPGVPRRAQRGAPPGPGAIRPGSTLIEEVRFATVSPPEGDDPNPRPRWCLVSLLGSRREDRVPTRRGKTMAATL